MSMTKEEAIEYFKMKVSAREAIGNDTGADYEAYKIALTALTPPAEDNNVPTKAPNDLLTLEELKAEAKRKGYKLIKNENIKFEPCLCGGTQHEWWSGPKGNKVVCLRCGLESPWVPESKGNNGVKKAWNAMILEKRKEA